jgi:hypothetical protein
VGGIAFGQARRFLEGVAKMAGHLERRVIETRPGESRKVAFHATQSGRA